MMRPLWTFDDLAAAAGGTADGAAAVPVTGFSIDTRALQPGDVFVALKDQRDGHDFVTSAFKAGATAAVVSDSYKKQPGDGALIRVAETLAGLEAIGRAARARLSADARVIAVTGSAGKTGTKDMLRACVETVAPGRVHASDKSFNNHWGVPLTLARMPAGTRYAVFEIGMNHAGEITPLTKMVRPHAAIVTTVEAVHLAAFKSVEEIAGAKAEIFLGLEPGGAAIINRDNPHFARLESCARAAGARIISFGREATSRVRLTSVDTGFLNSKIEAQCGDLGEVSYRLAIPGLHIVQNSLAVLGALLATGDFTSASDLACPLAALESLEPPPGRGRRFALSTQHGECFVIDESYNANPASMRAALAVLGLFPRDAGHRRRIAVLGDMLELGSEAPVLHAGLADSIATAGVDLVFAAGPNMKALYDVLPAARRGSWAEKSEGLRNPLLERVAAGDVIMVKGSNGSRMAPLVEALKAHFGTAGGRG